jgi:hypothetical protein
VTHLNGLSHLRSEFIIICYQKVRLERFYKTLFAVSYSSK